VDQPVSYWTPRCGLLAFRQIRERLTLNKEQRVAFFCSVDAGLRRQKDSENYRATRLSVTGPGGTGKSHVIRAVREWYSAMGLGHVHKATAHTGSAAFLIGGSTIHSAFGVAPRSDLVDTDKRADEQKRKRVEVMKRKAEERLRYEQKRSVQATELTRTDSRLVWLSTRSQWSAKGS
jgi:hypothetical protein